MSRDKRDRGSKDVGDTAKCRNICFDAGYVTAGATLVELVNLSSVFDFVIKIQGTAKDLVLTYLTPLLLILPQIMLRRAPYVRFFFSVSGILIVAQVGVKVEPPRHAYDKSVDASIRILCETCLCTQQALDVLCRKPLEVYEW